MTVRNPKGIYDKITYDYIDMDDVPFDYNEPTLRKMQKMERSLIFILDNLDNLKLSLDGCAEVAGYGSQYYWRTFKEYFGIPFAKYVSKLRLRQAAREIMDEHYPADIGIKYGFSSVQSFSKAFRNEFGISPRAFYTGRYNVPDMPDRHSIEGLAITMEYRSLNALDIDGITIRPPYGNKTYLMDAVSFIYDDKFKASLEPEVDLSMTEKKAGLWWYERGLGMQYIFGRVTREYDVPYSSPDAPSDKSGGGTQGTENTGW